MKAMVNGVTLAYDDHGVGWPLIFLHAFPLTRGMWEGEIKALLPLGRYRLVALDWRGFGESEIAGDLSTMELFADDVAGLMDTLGMQDAILCGLSMGGYAAFAFLRKYPRRVKGLILADTRPGADTTDARANRENVARLAESEGAEAIANLQLPRLISAETCQNRPGVEARLRQLIDAATPRGIAAASRGMALRADSSDLLASISVPTLVIVGEQDALIPPAVTQEYAARIPASRLITIPQAGHLSNLEQPAAFLQAVNSFLTASFL